MTMRHNVKKQTVRLTAEEYDKLKMLSIQSGLSMESLIRKLIMGEALRSRPPDSYTDLLRQLSARGKNINQIAYWANATKGISKNEIHDVTMLVQQAFALVKETL